MKDFYYVLKIDMDYPEDTYMAFAAETEAECIAFIESCFDEEMMADYIWYHDYPFGMDAEPDEAWGICLKQAGERREAMTYKDIAEAFGFELCKYTGGAR